MLIASSSSTDGVMNSQAMARSDIPRNRNATRRGVRATARSARLLMLDLWFTDRTRPKRRSPGDGTGDLHLIELDLTLFLEHLLPILDQKIEGFLGRPLVGDDVVMDALLHIEQQCRIGGLRPEVLHHIHGLQEVAGKRRALCKAGIVEHGLVAGIAAERPPLLLNFGLCEPFDVG